MPLLSDRESFDRLACKRAYAGQDSQKANQGRGFTVEEACTALDWPMPLTEQDLKDFASLCETWGVKTNIDDVPYFAQYRKDGAR